MLSYGNVAIAVTRLDAQENGEFNGCKRGDGGKGKINLDGEEGV